MNFPEENKNYLSALKNEDFPLREGLFSILRSTKQVVLNSTYYKDFIYKSSKINNVRFQSPERLKFPPIDAGTFHLTYKHDPLTRAENISNINIKQIKQFHKHTKSNLTRNSINNLENFEKSQGTSDNFIYKVKKTNEVSQDTVSIEDLYDKEAFLKKVSKDGQSLYKILSKDEILSYLKLKVKDLIKNGTENLTSCKSKSFSSFDQIRNYKLEFTIKSIYLRIKENANSQNKVLNEMSLELPFSLLYLFYYTNNSNFIFILSQVIKFNENYSKINIDIDKVNKILKNFEEKILNNDKLHPDSNFLIKNVNSSVDIITTNKIYQMTISLPSVNLVICETQSGKKLIIKKKMPKSLLIQILQKNFLKWDLYVIDYLTEYRNFRENILLFTNNNIIISKRSKKFEKEINFLDLDAHEKVSKPQFSEEKKFELIYINQMTQNIFISLESYKAKYNPNNQNTQVNHVLQTVPVQNFNFNFRQSLSLEKVSVMKPLDEFLNRCLIQRGRGMDRWVELDYQVIDDVDDDYLLYLLKNNSDKNKVSPEKDRDQNHSAFSITYPQLSCCTTILDHNGFLSSRIFSIEIPQEIFIKFENLEINSPSHLIKEFLNDYISNMESSDPHNWSSLRSRSTPKSKPSQSPSFNNNRRSLQRKLTSTKVSFGS